MRYIKKFAERIEFARPYVRDAMFGLQDQEDDETDADEIGEIDNELETEEDEYAHSPVGDSINFNTSATSAQSAQFTVQSDTLRVVALTNNAHVAIGTTAVATTADYFVPAGTTATLALTPGSSPIAGISTGSSTTIDLPEGTGNPFVVDDVLTITGVNRCYWF